MSGFKFEPLTLEGAYCIDAFSVNDNRGGFTKSFERRIFAEAGLSFELSETFASISAKNVIRGLHFQLNSPQIKIVSVLSGKAWDVLVDLRADSPTYKKWEGIELSADNHKAVYIPRGFAHGFASLEDNTIMLYQCDGAYNNQSDTGILYNDPDIEIIWPISDNEAIHSQRDMKLMSFKEYETNPMIINC